MKYKHKFVKNYDNWEIQKATDILSERPYEAKNILKNYIETHPNDYIAKNNYAMVLILLCNYEKALNTLNSIKDISFCNHYTYILNKLKLFAGEEKYEESYQLLLQNKYFMKESNFYFADLFYKKKLGILENKVDDKNSYLENQIINYSEDEFKKHIEKHQSQHQIIDDNNGYFAIDFPIDQVIEEIKKYIPSNKKLFNSLYADAYTFKYDACGRYNYLLQDYFQVISLHNTQDFITMLPINNGEYLNYIDLNYINSNNISKTKRMSQIDKFNLKYKRK